MLELPQSGPVFSPSNPELKDRRTVNPGTVATLGSVLNICLSQYINEASMVDMDLRLLHDKGIAGKKIVPPKTIKNIMSQTPLKSHHIFTCEGFGELSCLLFYPRM